MKKTKLSHLDIVQKTCLICGGVKFHIGQQQKLLALIFAVVKSPRDIQKQINIFTPTQ
jgi:hypothetical protein